MEPKVFVIMPVYNRKFYTEACLLFLEKQTYENMEVIVVDDGSRDGTAEMVREKFPSVTLLKGDGSLWWLGANNLALGYVKAKASTTDVVMLLNDDLIFGTLLIEMLVRAHNANPTALIGSVESIQGTEDIIYNGGIVINWWVAKGKNLNVGKSVREFPAGHTVKVSYLNGRGVLIPMRIIRDIGLFDTRYVHMGDFEYGVRAQKRGYPLLRTYDAVVYHYAENPRGIAKSVYQWSDLRAYLTDERSYANFKNLVLNSMLCTKNPLQGISYFIFGLIGILGHFVKGIYFTKAQEGII